MKKGFTMVEVMVVVAILSLVCAIAIPNLVRDKCKSDCEKGNCSEECMKMITGTDFASTSYDVKKFCEQEDITEKEFNNSTMLQNRFKLWVETGGK
jgi:prepilin-type N-terminal cleavage/methylation domain-containing protein